MPIVATCACGKKYQLKDEFAGRRAKCPACGGIIAVPNTTAQAAPPRKTVPGRKAQAGGTLMTPGDAAVCATSPVADSSPGDVSSQKGDTGGKKRKVSWGCWTLIVVLTLTGVISGLITEAPWRHRCDVPIDTLREAFKSELSSYAEAWSRFRGMAPSDLNIGSPYGGAAVIDGEAPAQITGKAVALEECENGLQVSEMMCQLPDSLAARNPSEAETIIVLARRQSGPREMVFLVAIDFREGSLLGRTIVLAKKPERTPFGLLSAQVTPRDLADAIYCLPVKEK